MAYLNPDNFYTHHYTAPTSSAFGGTLGKPKPKPAATSTPAAPSSSSSTPAGAPQGFTVQSSTLPPDPAYSQTVSGLGQGLTNTLAGLKQNRGAYLLNAGFTEDPNNPGHISFDPNNPYSQAALLKRSYDNAARGNTNSYASAGQLYAGSLQNAQNATTHDYNASENHLENAVINFLANNTSAANTAQSTYNTGMGQALGQAIQNAPNNPLYNPSATGTGGSYATDANGNVAIVAGPNGTALVPQQSNSVVKLASGWSVLLDANGNAIKFIPPGG